MKNFLKHCICMLSITIILALPMVLNNQEIKDEKEILLCSGEDYITFLPRSIKNKG